MHPVVLTLISTMLQVNRNFSFPYIANFAIPSFTGYLQMVFKNLGVTDFKVVRVEYTLAGVMSGMEPLLPKKTDSIETARKQAQQIAMNLFGDKNEVSESASSTGESAIEELISSPAPVLTVDTLPEKLPTSEEPTVSEEVAPSNEAIALESDSTTIEAPKIADVTPYEHLPPHQELEREETAKVPEVEKEVIAETATPSSIMEDIPAPEVVAPSMRTGYMMKRGHLVKNWKNRYFVLDNGSLTYYEGPQKLPPYGSGKKGSLEIKGATVASSGSQVTIVAGSNDLILEIKDTRDRVDWITALKKHATYYSK